MTTTHTPVATAVPPAARVAAGTAGGLAGGLMFGVLMQMMDMIPMVAMLVGSTSTAAGWLVHLAISAGIGASFAVLFARWATSLGRSTVLGMGYGVVWWFLGALLLMPARLGMDVLVFDTTAWQSLMGHLIFGLLLGGGYALTAPRLLRR